MSADFDRLVAALAATAARWQDPDAPDRAAAVAQTLARDNRFTEEATAFAVNQQMALLTPEALRAWVGGRRAAHPRTVGVLHPGNLPLVELQDALAVLLVGHRYVGSLSSRAPDLLPAFLESVAAEYGGALPLAFVAAEALFEEAEAVLATGSDEAMQWVAAQCEAHAIPPARRLLRGHRYAVAVLDGRETEAEREALAEDALLHEGTGCRSVALLWAPRETAPDPYLEAMAAFRGVFPAHPSTPGRLQMQKAFLEAVGQPHAFGEGLEFLLSRGAPEPQPPGHLRWAEYDDLSEVAAWLTAQAEVLQAVVVAPRLRRLLPAGLPYLAPGEAQRPPLHWRPDGHDTIAFLAAL